MNATETLRPLDALPPDAWRRVVGVATDLDDTLTRHGNLTSASLAALEALAAHDVPCVIATGRPVGWAEVLAGMLPVRAVVAENGGAWAVREGRGVRVAFLDAPTMREQGMNQARAVANALRARFPMLHPVVEHTLRATDVTLDVGERVRVPRDVVEAALAYVRDAGMYAVASTVHLHVSYRAPDKTQGLRAALADTGLDADALTDRWIYLGDSPNDAGPFAAMALSVGVRGVDALPMAALPRYVAQAGAGEALTEVVARLLQHRSVGA